MVADLAFSLYNPVIGRKLSITGMVLTVVLLLGVADAALLEGLPQPPAPEPVADLPPSVTPPASNPSLDPTPTLPPPPPGGVRRHTGPPVLETLVSNGFTFQDTREKFIVERVVPDKATVSSRVLLQNGDRAGAMAWIDTPQVKQHYLVLKEALHTAFTADVKDLLDETQRREGQPTRNLLTFVDPGLLPERVVFVRVRERLYEFHVPEGSSDVIFDLIEDLTQ